MSRVLVASHEPVGTLLAGPAMRAVEIARALGTRHAVTLAVPRSSTGEAPGVETVQYGFESLAEIARGHDVAIVSGLTYNFAHGIKSLGIPIALDIFIPFLLEELQAQGHADLAAQRTHHTSLLNAMQEQLLGGDFFLCASEKQRDFWLGALALAGRLNPDCYADDPTFRGLIDTVPFGVPADPPVRRPVLKGPGCPFDAGDTVLYWGGGLYDWFDPLTLIEAVARLHARGRTDLRLFFSGVRHPNPDVHEMQAVSRARRRTAELGLGGAVVFNDWVPYEERGAYLADADAGVSLHLDHIETRFSFRTRLVDYIWAGLPMVVSEGDSLGQELVAAGVAETVAEGDVDGAVAAIATILAPDHPSRRPGVFDALQERYRWERVIEPLERFCAAPRPAPDRRSVSPAGASVPHPHSRLGRATARLRRGDIGGLARDVRQYVAWRRQR